jgi:hypothetical protein
MSGSKNIFIQAITSKEGISSKRLLGFEAFHLAFLILTTQIILKVFCNIDMDLKPYFDSALIFSAAALGISMVEKFSPSKQQEVSTSEVTVKSTTNTPA